MNPPSFSRVFERMPAPAWSQGRVDLFSLGWVSWTPAFRNFLSSLSGPLEQGALPVPELWQSPSGGLYSRTYTLPGLDKLSNEMRQSFDVFVEALMEVDPGRDIWFLCDLIGLDVQPKALHLLLAYHQSRCGEISGGALRATYAPLSHTGPQGSAFPLHADLYPQSLVFMVYNNVPRDDSGSTLLLREEEFSRIVRAIPEIPAAIVDEMERLLKHPSDADGYEKFYSLLYSPASPWRGTLLKQLLAACQALKFPPGGGLIFNDRLWLHGRSKPSAGVPEDRLFRLAFDSKVSSS